MLSPSQWRYTGLYFTHVFIDISIFTRSSLGKCQIQPYLLKHSLSFSLLLIFLVVVLELDLSVSMSLNKCTSNSRSKMALWSFCKKNFTILNKARVAFVRNSIVPSVYLSCRSFNFIHCKNRIVKITNVLVSAVARI